MTCAWSIINTEIILQCELNLHKLGNENQSLLNSKRVRLLWDDQKKRWERNKILKKNKYNICDSCSRASVLLLKL